MHPLHQNLPWRSWTELPALPKKPFEVSLSPTPGSACSQAGESSLEPGTGLCQVWGIRVPSQILSHIPGKRQSPGALLVCPLLCLFHGENNGEVSQHIPASWCEPFPRRKKPWDQEIHIPKEENTPRIRKSTFPRRKTPRNQANPFSQ